ncbi:fluoride efflux transporter CrcB [Aminipila sp.]|uniref:fluoride efflux transporter CrcB n=1 Tax=Aminipila sp. TaxID=2060095 RepID=UPI00289C4422|nr:fluoride efflux transporter CrcB [Aminipila sp.]
MNAKKYIIISIMGMLGAACRYLIGMLMPATMDIPYGILAANLLGSFLLPIVFILLREISPIPADLVTGIGTGFIGAFTTFSSFTTDTVQLILDGEVVTAACYSLGNLIGGLVLAVLSVIVCDKFLKYYKAKKESQSTRSGKCF